MVKDLVNAGIMGCSGANLISIATQTTTDYAGSGLRGDGAEDAHEVPIFMLIC